MKRIKDSRRIKRLAAEINQNDGEVILDPKRVSVGFTSDAGMTLLIEEQDGSALLQKLPFKLDAIEIGIRRCRKRMEQ